ncbi:uncharacterized protein LOC134206791 [Armigeres subalbatus]|uniref:uncharacterized protein LOC134206791 n=1 Tax=Armigeres subalbatus TaxID=124917 RepID=UPI002ED3E36E
MKPAKENDVLPDNPFFIRKSIEAAVGTIEDARPEARGTRYVLKVRQKRQIEKLLALKQLIDGTAICIELHGTLNIRKCIVSCQYGLNLPDDELTSLLGSQRVIEVRRFTKRDPKDKKTFIPTNTMVLTIQGTTIPDFLYFGYVRVRTRPYYPAPLQCTRCHRFGHSKKFCTEKEICADCSSEHAESTPCVADPLCVNCSGPHSSRSRDCPVKLAEAKIVKIKVDQDVSYGEARKRHQATIESNDQEPAMSSSPSIKDLLKKLDEKDQENAKLRMLLQNLIKEVADLKKNNHPSVLATTEIPEQLTMDTSEEQKVSKRQRSKDISPTVLQGNGRNSPPLKKSSSATSQVNPQSAPNNEEEIKHTKKNQKKHSHSHSKFCISPDHQNGSNWSDPNI